MFSLKHRDSGGGGRSKLADKLPTLYKNGNFSDITLQFFHHNTKESLPIIEIKTHRNILSACGSDVMNRFVDISYREGVRIELDFESFSPDVVHLLFSLLYYNDLTPELLASNYENITQLHQLSLYFQFHSLTDLCLGIIFSLFTLEHLPILMDYCCPPKVSEDKTHLYTKLMRWDQLCHSSMIEKEGEGEENLEFLLPGKSIVIEDSRTRLYHYRRLCHRCLTNGRFVIGGDKCVVDMGYLEREWESGPRWNFSMTYRKNDPTSLTLYIKQSQQSLPPSPDDHMSIETMRIKSVVSLFSKLIDDPIIMGDSEVDTLTTITPLSQLTLHDHSHCYESQCDSCRLQTSVFIFCITVDIIK
jgi:hypothetical protein